MTAAERLAALREKKKQLVAASSPTGRLDGTAMGAASSERGTKGHGEGASDGSDDEGESSEESDLDEGGNPIFDEESKVKPIEEGYDPRGIVFRRLDIARPDVGSMIPPAASLTRVSSASKDDEDNDGENNGINAIDDDTMPLLDDDEDDAFAGLLQDEGFFMPEVPQGVPRRNVARLEDRLLREMESEMLRLRGPRHHREHGPDQSTAEHWFTPGGSLNVEEDPSNANITQPVDADPILADKDTLERCATKLVPPSANVCTSASASGVTFAGLDIAVHSIAFDDHPLFVEEDVTATKLRGLYRRYQQKVQENLLEYLTSHLGALLEYESQLRENASRNADALLAVRRQILDMFSRRLSEELELRELTKETYEQWLQLKSIRQHQGFTSTNLKLVVMHQDPAHTPKQVDHLRKQVAALVDSEFDGKLEGVALQKAKDLLQRHKLSRPEKPTAEFRGSRKHARKSKKIKKKKAAQKRRSSSRNSDNLERDSTDSDEQEDSDEDESYGDDRGRLDSSNVVLRLNFDGSYDKDEDVPAAELKRRRAIRLAKVHIAVYVNDACVAQTADASLCFPGFLATWNRVFCLKLQQRPSRLRLDVCASGHLFAYAKTLASVFLPIPASQYSSNVLAHGVGAEDDWHEFTARKPIRKWLWEKPSGVAKSKTLRELYAEQLHMDHVEVGPALGDRFTAGQVRATITWNTREADEDASGTGAGARGSSPEQDAGVGTLVGLPEWTQTRGESRGRLLGSHAGELAGGNLAGGGGGVSADATEFDDAVPDFANEVDFQKLIAELKGLDPNDPRNASVLRLFDIIKWSSKRRVLFRSEALLRDALFPTANADKFVESRRVALMRLRKDKPHLFHHPIPVSEEEIRGDETLQTLLLPAEAQLELDQDDAYAASSRSSSEVLRIQRMQKARVNDFLQRVRSLQSSNVNAQRRRDIPVGSVVKEGPLPQFSVNMDMFRALFEPRRRLRPAPRIRKPASLSVEKASIFVQVVRAQNVPVRRRVTNGVYPSSPGRSPRRSPRQSPTRRSPRGGDGQGDDGTRFGSSRMESEMDGGDEEEDLEGPASGSERVMSFVQVKFQGNSRRSSAQEGPSPTWNESIFLPFIPPRKDFSPANLQSISDHVHFNVFDEVIVETQGEDYRNEDAMFQRRERRFLGSFSIPFSTIYMNGRIEGMFRVETPAVNLGYVQRSRGAAGYRVDALDGAEIDEGARGPSSNQNLGDLAARAQDEASNATYVYLMATLDPVLATAKDENSTAPGSGENPKVARYAKQWVSQVKRKASRPLEMNTQVFGVGIDGDAIFAPRFIAPQVPPAGRDGSELQSVPALVRFVSLIPFLEDWQAFVEGGNDVWSTSQQFLDISAGDWEEHAILLCNYLAWLFSDRPSVEPYIIMGYGIPEGATVYVLLADSSSATRLLFNASTGRCYAVSDANCPLRDVGLVINERNIWANVQEHGAPWQIKWNFENAKDWVPFWTSRVPRIEMASVQTEVLTYERLDRRFVSYLEGEISEQIQKSMRRWRAKRGTTRFNKIVGRKLRALLESLEEHKLEGFAGGMSALVQEHLEGLRETMSNNSIFGFPLNMTFTEMDAILRAVRNSDIHNTTLDNTTFALAVLVVPYTNKVFSVWIYLATIVSTRF
ncbi:Coiled-coil and C2 domain-containing protein 2A [Hondaea fermentalgiana]|uniref:Coiled-coil and C2 domain-containing protein 2A n=1 Tax=Hondaea fermentalgiana TaxID=2315210 RepID=A0A2R5GCV3_9STRA|nr:Coiled-coil and C2 domain-containing protein 2A [Hondaea fermentalgiana]|eukprot:GBG28149.1 Coiled-coil and C2 domain-containing protein 2A [Hondaea fermentalgiana]